MKKIYLLAACLLLSLPLFAQRHPGRGEDHPRIKDRLEEFEKVRLLEVLDLDEETAVKFIIRRKDHRKTMDSIIEKRFSMINDLQNNIKSEKYSDTDIKKDINKILNIEKELAEERSRYIVSLYDILTVEQVAKVITFEDRFRSDIKEMIEQRGKPPKGF